MSLLLLFRPSVGSTPSVTVGARLETRLRPRHTLEGAEPIEVHVISTRISFEASVSTQAGPRYRLETRIR